MKRNDRPRDEVTFADLPSTAKSLVSFLEQPDNRDGVDDAAIKERYGWDDGILQSARVAAADYVEEGGTQSARPNRTARRDDKTEE